MPSTIPHPLARPHAPEVSVVIVNFNAWADVDRLVSALAHEPEVISGRCEVVVVDNASDEAPPESLTSLGESVRCVMNPHNAGFASGVNSGWKVSRGPWLLLLNPDIEIAAGFMGRVLDRVGEVEGRPEGPPAVVGFGLRNPDGTRQPSVGVDPGLLRSLWGQFIPRSRRKYQSDWRTRPGPVAWVTGACALVQASLLNALGGMDEDYFLYYEEVALCRSARDRGLRIEYDPTVEVVHSRPLQNRPISARMRVITRHSKLLYFRKFLPRWEFLALSGIIEVEARGRGLVDRLRGDREGAGAWKAIAGLSRAMRRGSKVGGRAVLEIAAAATSPKIPNPKFRTTARSGRWKTSSVEEKSNPA